MSAHTEPSTFDSELDDSMGFLIADTGRAVKRALYLRIAQHDIRGGHWYCLRTLFEQDGITQRELSERLGIKGSSTVEMLRAMELENLVYRERDTEDKRKVRVYLTDHARSLQPLLTQILKELRELMVSNMSKTEETLLKLLLRQLRQTLENDSNMKAATLSRGDASMIDTDSDSDTWLGSKAIRSARSADSTKR